MSGRQTHRTHITNHDSIVEGRCPAFRIFSSCVMSLGHTHPYTPGLRLGKGGFSFVDREWEDANDCSLVRQKRSWFLPCDFEDLEGLYFLQRSYNHIAKTCLGPILSSDKSLKPRKLIHGDLGQKARSPQARKEGDFLHPTMSLLRNPYKHCQGLQGHSCQPSLRQVLRLRSVRRADTNSPCTPYRHTRNTYSVSRRKTPSIF